ncbi:hypothetical protein O181_039063 [Austropuccinia psidii MF-1]|uniref:Uncharacterized protein n=1 Tax=Austropuccinia psidii MF-1 TaxID=1389203 RepID=A0A9Q3DEM1_9BASI|nr:hypothetical protein [Austropuccinia psidii MF-1]
MGTSDLEYIGPPPIGMGSPTLVHLATSLFLEPVTNTRYKYKIQSRESPYSQLEYPKVPLGVGASETGNSFPKGPVFFHHKYLLTLEAGIPGQQHGFFPKKQKWNFEEFGLKYCKHSFPFIKNSVQAGSRTSTAL